MEKLVLVVTVTEDGHAEGAEVMVWNIVHYAVVKDIKSGNILAEDVDKPE